MRYAIQIPKPCHESWQDMTPEGNGRHCAQCCKTVVDFSGWEQADVVQYLRDREHSHVCGRFRADQVDTAINETDFIHSVTYAPMPLYKKIAAIFLFAFGLLHMGSNAIAQSANTPPRNQLTGVPVQRPMLTGGAVARAVPVKDTAKRAHQQVKKAPDHHLMGKPVNLNKKPNPAVQHLPDEQTYKQGEVYIKPPGDTARNKH